MMIIRANSFSNRIVNTWNSLTENVVSAPSLNTFKSRLNQCWKRHPRKFEAACYNYSQQPPAETNIKKRQKKPQAYPVTSNRYESYQRYERMNKIL